MRDTIFFLFNLLATLLIGVKIEFAWDSTGGRTNSLSLPVEDDDGVGGGRTYSLSLTVDDDDDLDGVGGGRTNSFSLRVDDDDELDGVGGRTSERRNECTGEGSTKDLLK